jgi:hypothetical protein
MPIVAPDVATNAQWDWIVAKLQAEVQPGGRLSAVNYVGKSYDLWTEAGVHIGVQLKDSPLSFGATNQRDMISEFWIITGTHSTEATAAQNTGANTPPNLDDANLQLRAVIGTGDGNGLMGIFRDADTYTLGGNATQVFAHPPEYDWIVKRGDDPDVQAFARIKLFAKSIVWVPGAS